MIKTGSKEIPLNISTNLTDKTYIALMKSSRLKNRPSLELRLCLSGFSFQKDKNSKIKCILRGKAPEWKINPWSHIRWMVYPQGCLYQKSLLLTKFFWLNLGCWKQHVTVKRFRFKTFKFSPVLKQLEVRVQILHESKHF